MKSPPPRRRTGAGAMATFIVSLAIVGMLIWVASSPGLLHFSLDSHSATSSHNIQLNSGNYNVTYSWEYPYGSNREWTIKVTIPATTYNYYSDPAKTSDYASYVTKDDSIVDRIASELKNDAKNNSFDTAQFVLSFVQNIPYGTDENTTTPPTDNYPRYSDETLVDGVGDCKDHSVLYASLMESPAINVDMVLFLLTKTGVSVGHMAAGLLATGYTGTYVQYQGGDYFYCETTSSGWTIGDMPPEMDGYAVQVLAI
jgi:transglutaminase-like putative cysteine protease